jgi:hypothetical protein
VFFDEEPIPLRFCPALAKKKSAGIKSSAWVLQTMKEICHFVGLSCEGFEEELLALFTQLKQVTLIRSRPLVPNWVKEVVEN